MYHTDDPKAQVDMLNSLITDIISRHAPLRRTKVTRPPAPWMKELDIQQLQRECHTLRTKARCDKSEPLWTSYRDKRRKLKSKIKKTKRDFYSKALSSNKPKEVWKTIHSILHPSPQPLRHDPDDLNQHFASTAVHVTGCSPTTVEDINKFFESLPANSGASFSLKPVTSGQVLKEIKLLRSDCSCGPDSIPVKFIKAVPDHLALPLTHILNNCISNNMFPAAWKIARISPIPKCAEVKTNKDLRPISILPVLSKIYERLVLGQMQNSLLSKRLLVHTKGPQHNNSTTRYQR